MSNPYDDWAEKIQYEVYQYWKENHQDWEEGFQVFYSPANESASILILGINPGSGENTDRFKKELNWFEQNDFSLPDEHHYLCNSRPLGDEMVDLLGETIIENSVKSNVNFFRSKTREELKEELSSLDRMDEWIETLIQKIDPDVIIAEGIGAYNTLTSEFVDVVEEEKQKREIEVDGKDQNYNICCVAQTSKDTVVGIPHLTGRGSYVYDESHKKIMRDTIRSIIEKNTSINI